MPSLVDVVLAAAGTVFLAWSALLAAFARPAVARWREPVFRYPTLVLESDDWGAGPLAQANALHAIAAVLRALADATGRPPVMMLGVVLEIPDGERMTREGFAWYRARSLDASLFAGVRDEIEAGAKAGIFVPILHGRCHYWPDAVMRAAADRPALRAWLGQAVPARNEDLPPPLQSRFVDGSTLPSRDIDATALDAAAREEVAAFEQILGRRPELAVATTFVWNETVEAAWRGAGIDVVVTAGHRCTGWSSAGRIVRDGRRILTGERARAGQLYLVRDLHFEPAQGHRPDDLVQGVRARSELGRASLIEIHRANFLDRLEPSLATLQRGLRDCQAAFRDLRFASSLELARAIRERDRAWLDLSLKGRLRAWLARLPEIPRFQRLARATGFDHARLALARIL